MATSPAPDAAAPPGMCPGIAVLGGGGGGGDGDGSGSGGKDGAGGDGDGKGEGAGGDGTGSGNCGPGSEGGCPTHSHQVGAGDPIDVGSGAVFTFPIFDVVLPGPLPLRLSRRYSTTAKDHDVGLGHGWAHTFGWEITVGRRTLVARAGEGSTLEFPVPEVGESVVGREGWLLRRHAWGYALESQGLSWVFAAAAAGGSKFLLSSLEDENQNRIVLRYEEGALVSIVDSVGRVVDVKRTPQGRIEAFEIKNAVEQGRRIRLVEFTYDRRGDLVETRDALGALALYTYDDQHQLTSSTLPDRPTFHFRYDERGRCVESWGANADGSVPGLSPNAPATLADGRTRAKGFMHVVVDYHDDGYREVTSSLGVRRIFADGDGRVEKDVVGGRVTSRAFDALGLPLSQTDAGGGTTTWERDERGRVIKRVDALGHVTVFRRDASGRVIEATDDLGTIVRIHRDVRGNPIEIVQSGGEVTLRKYDPRGLVLEQVEPDGTVLRFGYDAHGNLVRSQEPSGAAYTYQYDYLGRRVVHTDPLGQETRIGYDDKGRIVALRTPNGGVERRVYNGAGNLVELVEPDRQTWRAAYLYDRLIRAVHPGGATLHYRYDREGLLTEFVNEKGEVRVHHHDESGRVTEVLDFDGRRTRFRFDAMGRLTRYTNGNGEHTELTRDLLGQILEVAYPDGTSAKFAYDARGRLLHAENATGVFDYVVDAAGQPVRETHEVDGVRIDIERDYDAVRRCRRVRSSRGAEHALRRDADGHVAESRLDDDALVRFVRDPCGRELARILPADGRIESEYGLDIGVRVRRVVTPYEAPALGAGEPEWIGTRPSGVSIKKAFEYTLTNDAIVRRWDGDHDSRRYEYDPREQLVGVLKNEERVESFVYDESGNVHEGSGPSREYARGNVLVRKGAAEFRYDRDGRLVEKKLVDAPGQPRSYRYSWSGQGYLERVSTPDGLVVEFGYDPFARRVRKRVSRVGAGGDVALVSSSRFVWDRDVLFQEIRTSADAHGEAIVEETTYYHEGQKGEPLAERTDVIARGVRTRGELLFHVNDPIGTPEDLVRGDGRVAARLERSAWGKTTVVPAGHAGTRLRFPGQFADEETGLYYNRYRYYDPDLGRYISVDPAGNLPDANEFRYCLNPISWTDPLGLEHTALATWTPAGSNSPTDMNNGDPYASRYNNESDNYSRQYNAANGISPAKNFYGRNPDGTLAHRTSDTEAQVLRDVERDVPAAQRAGGTLDIVGTLPPCSSCNRRMQDFATTNKMTINYHHDGGVVTYPH